jgi:hypothetical protein
MIEFDRVFVINSSDGRAPHPIDDGDHSLAHHGGSFGAM